MYTHTHTNLAKHQRVPQTVGEVVAVQPVPLGLERLVEQLRFHATSCLDATHDLVVDAVQQAGADGGNNSNSSANEKRVTECK